MNSDQSEELIRKLYESGRVSEILKEYIFACSNKESVVENTDTALESKRKRSVAVSKSFPNLAGFCRHLGVSTEELDKISCDYPSQYGKLLAVLEDEALNSDLSPTLISAYMKKRLGYDSSAPKCNSESQLQIKFEHDIFEDGE